MANWIPITYALTGSKKELQDLEQKMIRVEDEARKNNTDPEWECVDTGDLAKLLGSEFKNVDLMGYWYYAEDGGCALEWKTTEDGEEYMVWHITNKYWENPKTREMIEGAYKTIKVFYDAPAEDTNDTEERYFKRSVKLTNIDGLNYALGKDGTAMLNADDSIKTKVLRVPEQVECNGETYIVDSFGDAFADPQYGSPTKAPTELEEIFFPATIKHVEAYNTTIESLKAIHFAGDLEYIGEYAFSCCKQLETVEFGGKVGIIDVEAFSSTAIKDIDIPDGTRVYSSAFNDSPFGNQKTLVMRINDVCGNKNRKPIPGVMKFLREMQYRMNVKILIECPFGCWDAVEYDKQIAKLNEQLRWIYDNLGDELLRNTVVGNDGVIDSIKEQADAVIGYYDWLNEIAFEISADDKKWCPKVNSLEDVKTILLDLDNQIQNFVNDAKVESGHSELPF